MCNIVNKRKTKLPLIINRQQTKRFERRSARFRFVGLTMATAIGIFLLSSELPSSLTNACVGGLNTGFFCASVTKITGQAPFNTTTNKLVLETLFLAINLGIGGRVLFRGYQAWSSREAGEEYQSIINGIIMGLVILFALEFFAQKIVGA